MISPSGVVALITDFGTRDHYVGSVKASVLSTWPDAVIVDITHEIGPQDILPAGFSLWAAFRDFPTGTVFVCVVDPGVGSDRRRIVCRTEEYQFVAPDNGVLSLVLGAETCELFELRPDANLCREISGTFDGRDFFGPVGARLASGVPAEEMGSEITDPVLDPRLEIPAPGEAAESGYIIHADRFGNLITNLWPENVASDAALEIGGIVVSERRRYFSDGPEGGLFIVTGSSGLLEVCSNCGSAADLLSARPGDGVSIVPKEGRLGQ